MAINKSPLALDYLRDIFDRALKEEHGIKITCKNHGEAMALRARLNWYRTKDKQANQQTYPSDHPLYGVSVWEQLVCKVGKKGTAEEAILRVQRVALDHLVIIPITPSDPD